MHRPAQPESMATAVQPRGDPCTGAISCWTRSPQKGLSLPSPMRVPGRWTLTYGSCKGDHKT